MEPLKGAAVKVSQHTQPPFEVFLSTGGELINDIE
jgi:hypothetical protein